MRTLVLLALLGTALALPKYLLQNSQENETRLKHLTKDENAEQLSGQFEGDIVMTPAIAQQLMKRNGMRLPSAKWGKKIIPFTISSDLNQEQANYVRRGLSTLELSTCLKFVNRTTEEDYIEVIGTPTGCWSYVGRQGGRQELNLELNTPESGCFRLATIMHEFLHALGFYHMQSSYDRDEYVEIKWENIQKGLEDNFFKYEVDEVTDFDIKYDYSSVMHYPPNGFSVNGQPTIVPKDPNAVIGQRVGLTRRDIEKVNRMYGCKLN